MPSASNMGAAPRERALHELLSRDMVDIYVGPENTHWILHEKLLCHRSRFFRDIFYNDGPGRKKNSGGKNHAYGLPDEDDASFKLFVGWLYAERVPVPRAEKELGPLLDLYLMAEKWEIPRLVAEALDAARAFYRASDSWPSLRRVQYVYANTAPESPMRQLLVQCVARMLVVGSSAEATGDGSSGGGAGGSSSSSSSAGAGATGMPAHWEKALRKNGALAVDVIMCVQKWRFEPDSVPDARIGAPEDLMQEAEERKRAENGVDGEGAEQLDWGSGLSQSHTEAESEHAI